MVTQVCFTANSCVYVERLVVAGFFQLHHIRIGLAEFTEADYRISSKSSEPKMNRHHIATAAALLACVSILQADDWAQWNGPTSDGVVADKDIQAKIPDGGLKKLWSVPVSFGFSGPAVANGKVYVTDYEKTSGRITNDPGRRDKLTGFERVHCLDASTGEKLWSYQYDRPYAVSYPSGPRVVPTIHDGLIYTIGAEGNLVCLDADFGDLKWQRDYAKEYKAITPIWGHSASPLIDGNNLICMVGGPGSLVVAFDLKTGKEQWKALSADDTGYCPVSMIEHDGVRQMLVWSPTTVYSLNPETRDIYWQHELKPGYGMSILPPMKDGNKLFVTGESSTCAMYELTSNPPGAKKLWTGTPRNSVYLATCSAIFEDGYIYGADIRSGAFVCADAKDGSRLWQTAEPTIGKEGPRGPAHASAFILKIDERYLLFSETGEVISATITPNGYTETGRFKALEPTQDIFRRMLVWTYPAVADKKLFLRNDEEIVCYDLSPQ